MSDDPETGGLVTVIIDGREVQLPAGKNLLEALLAQNVNMPYFCWHPKLGSVGACRQCAVVQYRNAEDTRGRIMMACMTPVVEGARFSLETQRAVDFRESVIETLMVNHPHDCPVCEEGGECHLQDMTVMVGHRDRRYRGTKVTFRNQYLGPLINHEMNRCITCYRCVRFYQDYAGGDDLGAFASRSRVYFGRAEDGVLQNEFAGNLVEVCPTGVFTDKTLSRHYTRKWDLESSPSVCTGCSLGCTIMVAARYGEFRRIHNRYNQHINGYFLCDRGRYGGNFVDSPARFKRAGVRNQEGKYTPVDTTEAIDQVRRLIAESARVIGIGSPRASLEANHTLARLVGEDNYFSGMNRAAADAHATLLEILSHTPAHRVTMAETEDYDAVLVLGEDVTNHAPRLALSLRQSVRNLAKSRAAGIQVPMWDDAAVRKLGQQDRSPLIVVTPMADRLDDVATRCLRAAPDDIAKVGFDIAHRLDASFPAGNAPGHDIDDIVRYLSEAKRPLIVSGTGLHHTGILKAAANIAAALAAHNAAAGVMLCGDACNSLGVTMMAPPRALESIIDGNDIETAVVLENDLTQRLSETDWQALRARVKQFIVIDCVDTDTASASAIALPSATFAECEGTFVNNEGAAQRAFAALPCTEDIMPAWRWLARIGQALQRPGFADLDHIDDVTADCAAARPALAAIMDAAPAADWREHGLKVARMTHRYSGRTAMHAAKSVHDPKPPQDPDSALAFSMEGASAGEPSALRPFVWSPGWNSNQSINKFQAEIGGSLKDGDPGVRLLGTPENAFQPYAAETASRPLQIVRRHHIFGSEELSGLAPAIGELAPRPYCAVGTALAASLDVTSGDGIEYRVGDSARQLEVVVDASLAADCIAVPVGLDATKHLANRPEISITKVTDWQRRAAPADNIIGSDGNAQ